MKELINKSVYAHARSLEKKEYSAVELTKAYLDTISQREQDVHAYISTNAEYALEQAKAADKRIAAGEATALTGIPAGIKDNICTKGIATTCASKMLADYVPPYDAHVIQRLQDAGYVLLGKLNMDEFAMGSTTENSAMGITRNPCDTTRVPGGSSGGSAAAVAAGEAAYTLGSDTGGSIRQPAAFCGVVGMKPTYGRVSRYGLVAFASSLDQIGPLTRDVRDNALVLSTIAGHDKRDATSADRAVEDYLAGIQAGVAGMRIGLPEEFFGDGISADVKQAVLAAADTLEGMGAVLVQVKMPSLDHALAAYYVISSAEASSNLARFDGVRYGYRAADFSDMDTLYQNSRSEGFGAEVKRRIMLGTFALSSGYYDAYYKKALQVRSLVRADFDAAFEKCDCILSPVAPTVAYKIGEKTSDPLEMYLGDAYSVPVNIAGLPALSMPCGTGEGGMPVGMQLIGPALSEAMLYRVGYAFERGKGEDKVCR
ncbi:MAG: Asp-tRNA(Asn)/Glu-tRNA(Gln) amidotransferase subunit GatA [Clostridiales bacterium]|jgi:aspartyl-tRNA(Asn)/glutamyl-tRNA(Gln) amidotransferase subunit A|nr:Asp-tRNA(Asn)/Glu-tRNA(Gln) amidotransferase subunit GatA [Clostridiales bacterium]